MEDLTKTPSNKLVVGGVTLLEGTSVDEPKINLHTVDIAELINYNYAYIPQFKRYYYILDKIYGNGGLVTLILESDPMYTFKSNILNSYQLVERQQSDVNTHIADNQVPLKVQKSFLHYKPEGSPVSNLNAPIYILQTAGRSSGGN